MSSCYKSLLVDDEPLALDRLERLLAAHPEITILEKVTRPTEAVRLIDALKPDLVFLDIQMPGMTGFEVLRKVQHQPLVIFVTAYDRYALEAFEANSIDYLLKPVHKDRLARAVQKLTKLIGEWDASRPTQDLQQLLDYISSQGVKAPPKLTSRQGERILVIEPSEVAYFYAESKYTFAVTAKGEYLLDYTLQQLRQWLPQERFLTIHRSYIVHLDWIAELARGFGGGLLCRLKPPISRDLPISRALVQQVRQRIQF